jgi:diadenosine tetraphosphate (Ap4A) HIT family hydrolase
VGEVKRLLDERLDPKPDGYNVGFNAGAAAGQTVPRVHVIPRYAGDMPDPRGGVRHVIPAQGKGDSHLLPVAKGDTAPAAGRGLQTKGGCHLFLPRSRVRIACAGATEEG